MGVAWSSMGVYLVKLLLVIRLSTMVLYVCTINVGKQCVM
jgi:hypothetical protein